MLDCACGTGDLTIAFGRKLRQDARSAGSAPRRRWADGHKPRRLVGLDYTSEMLIYRREGVWSGIEWMQGTQALPLPMRVRRRVDRLRHPQRAGAGAGDRQFRRAASGGRLVVPEFAEPRLAPVRWFNDAVPPRDAADGDVDQRGQERAYRYPPKSVSTFVGAGILEEDDGGGGVCGGAGLNAVAGDLPLYRAYVPTGAGAAEGCQGAREVRDALSGGRALSD